MQINAESYERLLARVEKPGRYLGNELGCVRKDPAAMALRVALCFPEVYEISQSHPGLQLLYDLLNRRADIYAERAYAPWIDLEAVLRQAGYLLRFLSHASLVGYGCAEHDSGDDRQRYEREKRVTPEKILKPVWRKRNSTRPKHFS